ncbi:MAG: hypothetical protein JOZ78_15925 [Chroococcidiopsidaceae cyanobacterium CP_BM_ER_R8_30]|nr:hypothetical protein [Chroococcidiopsidaceae cyanobacterium CP_BM_ER_R8_30]
MEPGTIGIVLSIFSATATAIWTVLTWNEQQSAAKEQQRDQVAALYVNPFLIACENLQRRLYDVLNENELEFFKQECQEVYDLGSPEAIELLYVIVIYFGWAKTVYRYGPYTNDRQAIELNRKISHIFSNISDFSSQAFYFSLSQQRSLGQTFVRTVGELNSIYPRFEATSLYKFAEELVKDINRCSPLYQNVRRTIKAIDCANHVEELEGRERLVAVQNYLVDLLSYLEKQEGFSVSNPLHQKASLIGSGISQFHTEMEVVHEIKGRVRLRIPQLRQDESYAEALRSRLQSLASVKTVKINSAAASITLNYSLAVPEAEFKQRVIEMIGQEAR